VVWWKPSTAARDSAGMRLLVLTIPLGQYPPPGYAPRPQKIVTVRKMSFGGHFLHLMMCFMTCGIWIPVYLSRLRSRKTVTRTY
jgi:hypothetical protein